MIGQINTLKIIDTFIENGFPRFLIITGARGQGKKLLASIIAVKLKYNMVCCEDVKINTMRNIIDLAYKQTESIIYLIPDADNMSIGAKNSMLKLFEEPPQNAYFILTLEDMNNTLPTIKSRCIELQMENYTEEEIEEMIDSAHFRHFSELEKAILLDVCNNYYQIDLLNKYGVQEFYKYVEKVVNNIYKVQSANSFKIAEKLDIKGDGNGYDLDLFFNTFQIVCMDNALGLVDSTDEDLKQDYLNYLESNKITSKYKQKLRINGINKQALIDNWILDIRKIWRS